MQILPPRSRSLGALGAKPWEAPLKPEELPFDLLYIDPRYTLKALNDLMDAPESLQQIEAWAKNPPDWVKKKNKLGQDSWRLAAFIRHRLNHRLPKNWFDSQIDSDASLVIQARGKYRDLSTQTLAEWSTMAPNWKPWNRDRDMTAVAMPAILWANRIASARAGADIGFFVNSPIEELADDIVHENDKTLLAWLEGVCNAIATWGISSTTSGTKAVAQATAATAGKTGEKTLIQKGTEQVTKQAISTAKREGEQAIRQGTQAVATAVTSGSDSAAKRGATAAATGVASAGIAYGAAAVGLATPVGWLTLALIALAPVLCWGTTEVALKTIKDNLRNLHPDFIPQFIATIYTKRFNAVPTPEQVAELDQRYSGLISANSLAKAVASPENDPSIIAAITKRQSDIRGVIMRRLKELGCPDPNPDRVASLANDAFNRLWSAEELNRRIYNNQAFLCLKDFAQVRSAILRSSLSRDAVKFANAAAKIRTQIPVLPPTITGTTPLPPVVPPVAPAKGGIGPALALATGGFFVGGPVGAGVGFVIGLAAGKKK